VTSPVATRPNQRWSMDFVSDCVSTGKVIRMLTIVDDCIFASSSFTTLQAGVRGIALTSKNCEGRLYGARCRAACSGSSVVVCGESGTS
jgi:hypothetical protein